MTEQRRSASTPGARGRKILVTGISGTGKSAALVDLGRRGFRVVDTDETGWREYRPYATPIDELHRGEFHWVEERMTALLDDDGRTLFVGGGARNQSAFYDREKQAQEGEAVPPAEGDRLG